MSIRKILLFAYCLGFSFNAYCIDKDSVVKPNSVFLDLFGSKAGLIGFNYEHIFHLGKKCYLTSQIGFTPSKNPYDKKIVLFFPLNGGLIYQFSKSCVEADAGVIYGIGTSNLDSSIIPLEYKTNNFLLYSLRLGYRFHSSDNLLFRIGPYLNYMRDPYLNGTYLCYALVGVSIGYNF